MKYRKLDPDGDYTFGGGSGDFLEGAEAVAQAVKTNLLLLYGEWWENTTEGLPLFQNILGQPGTPGNLQAVDLLVRARIAKTSGVKRIKSFSSSYENRKYSLNVTITTSSGDDATVEVSY